MAAIFSSFSKILVQNKVEDSYDGDVIALWVSKSMSKFKVPADIFNQEYYNYICKMVKNKTQLTISSNNYSISNAYNVIYLDGDYTFNTDKVQDLNTYKDSEEENDEEEEENEELTQWMNEVITTIYKKHLEIWHEILDEHNISIKYEFVFTPFTLKNNEGVYKGGHHVFLILEDNVDKDMRAEMYDEMVEAVDNDEDFKSYILENTSTDVKDDDTKWITQLFDSGPIKTASPLMLYGQKSKSSRNYKCVSHNFVENGFENFVGILPNDDVKNSVNKKQNITSMSITLSKHVQDLLNDPDYKDSAFFKHSEQKKEQSVLGGAQPEVQQVVDEQFCKDFDELYSIFDMNSSLFDMEAARNNNKTALDDNNLYKKFGANVYFTIKFVKSLAYLCPEHKLFSIIANHDQRIFTFIKPLMEFVYVNIILKNHRDLDEQEGRLLCGVVARSLIPLLKRTVTNESDPTKRDTIDSCLECVLTAYKWVKNAMSSKLKHIWFDYCKLSPKEKKELPPTLPANYKIDDTDPESATAPAFSLSEVNMAREKIKNYYINWIKVVQDDILENITTEIEPFLNQGEITRAMPNCREGVLFKDYIDVNIRNTKTLFYFNTLSNWIKMFIFILYLLSM